MPCNRIQDNLSNQSNALQTLNNGTMCLNYNENWKRKCILCLYSNSTSSTQDGFNHPEVFLAIISTSALE